MNGERISRKTQVYLQIKPIAKADLVLALVSTPFVAEEVARAMNGTRRRSSFEIKQFNVYP